MHVGSKSTLDVQGSRVFFHDTEFGVNWDGLAYCESTNNPHAVNNPAGFLSTYGLFQFDLPTWASVGGSGNPGDASPEEQLVRAKLLYSRAAWSRGCAATRRAGRRPADPARQVEPMGYSAATPTGKCRPPRRPRPPGVVGPAVRRLSRCARAVPARDGPCR